ncbi:MAG: VOC family protein, partial [Thermoplasmata archaeon]
RIIDSKSAAELVDPPFRAGVTRAGSVQGLHLIVSDLHAARAQLVERGVEVSEVKDFGGGISFVFFKDPDGNGWAVQHIAPGARRPET